jgi:hypothetical protein
MKKTRSRKSRDTVPLSRNNLGMAKVNKIAKKQGRQERETEQRLLSNPTLIKNGKERQKE